MLGLLGNEEGQNSDSRQIEEVGKVLDVNFKLKRELDCLKCAIF